MARRFTPPVTPNVPDKDLQRILHNLDQRVRELREEFGVAAVRRRKYSATAVQQQAETSVFSKSNGVPGRYSNGAGNSACFLPLVVDEGETIREIHAVVQSATITTGVDMRFFRMNPDGTSSQIGGQVTSNTTAVSVLSLTNLNAEIGSDLDSYLVMLGTSAANAGQRILSVQTISILPRF